MTRCERERERRAGHSKFHLSDLLLMIAVYIGNATPFSFTRHFNGHQVPGTWPKNSLMKDNFNYLNKFLLDRVDQASRISKAVLCLYNILGYLFELVQFPNTTWTQFKIFWIYGTKLGFKKLIIFGGCRFWRTSASSSHFWHCFIFLVGFIHLGLFHWQHRTLVGVNHLLLSVRINNNKTRAHNSLILGYYKN